MEETLAFLRQCHRDAPFLFFNGNTFADIGRRLTAALLADLPPARLRQATSAVGRFVAGVLHCESMTSYEWGKCDWIYLNKFPARLEVEI